jgi:hypothetical protein
VIEKILWLRKHDHFGPAKIAMYLARYHDVTISTSGVWRILKRLKMNRLPASQRYQRHERRWKRYEKQRPGHQLQGRCEVHRTAGAEGHAAQEILPGSPPSTTAPGSGSCAPTRGATRKPPSSSSTTFCPSCRSPLNGFRPTFKLGGALKVVRPAV